MPGRNENGGDPPCTPDYQRYFARLIKYSTASLTSASDAAPPLGGIGAFPFMTEAVSSSAPRFISGAQTALSPAFGFMAEWQPLHDLSYTALPSAAAGPATANSNPTAPRIQISFFIAVSFHVNRVQQ